MFQFQNGPIKSELKLKLAEEDSNVSIRILQPEKAASYIKKNKIHKNNATDFITKNI